MALKYPKENRIFEDMENSNQRFYRESEAHARIHHDEEHIREDMGFEKMLYEETHDPNKTFQEMQGKHYRSEMNMDQRHFPMLREYEKAKKAMIQNEDLDQDNSGMKPPFGQSLPGQQPPSPYNNFQRATTGKKLYYNDDKTGPLPPTRVTETTQLQKTRERILYRGENGLPMNKITNNEEFIPCNPGQAKEDLAAKNFGLYEDHYESKRMHDYEQYQFLKSKHLHGHFKKSNKYDHGKDVNEFGIMKKPPRDTTKQKRSTHKMSVDQGEEQSTRSQSHANLLEEKRMRNTNQKYENSTNGYQTFLNEKSELPRLSILDNYKQIMRIMTNSYIKGSEYQNKFKNRMENDIMKDEEYQRFKEEENNTKKMSTILKSLNAPFKRGTRGSQMSAGGTNMIHGGSERGQRFTSSNQSNISSRAKLNPNNDLNTSTK